MTEPVSLYDGDVVVHHGDCLDVMRDMPADSVDAVVCDPPYGLEFMGKEWDAPWEAGIGLGGDTAGFNPINMADGHKRLDRPNYLGSPNPTCRNCGGTRRGNDRKGRRGCRCDKPAFDNVTLPRMMAFQAWCQQWAAEALRVLKPGGMLLAFGGTRTSHRLACGIEDAGFEIRDSITWLYGSGFPKSMNIGKAIDKRPGVAQHAEFAADLRAAIASNGYTNTFDVSEGVTGRRTGAVANWQKYQFPEAKWWPALRDLLGMSDRWDAVIAEAERAVIGRGKAVFSPETAWSTSLASDYDITAPATSEAQQWDGWGTALKPAGEIVVCARKPAGQEGIGSHLERLMMVCRQDVSDAAKSFAPIRADSLEAMTDSAPEPAAIHHGESLATATPTGRVDDSSDRMDTSSLKAASLSIVSSWKDCWDELCQPTNTSTIEITSDTTTETKTLLSCLSKITDASMLLDPTSPDGLSSIATAVDNLFAAAVLRSRATRTLSAVENVTDSTVTGSQVGGGSSPASEPIIVARKPLGEKTVAANVLRWGTGGIHVDATRVGAEEGDSTADGSAGRWPPNVVLTDVDLGEETRFFPTFRYQAKAGTAERPYEVDGEGRKIAHPTCKPLELMRWLVRLVVPVGALVLDPFGGSGTTGEACLLENMRCVLIEQDPEYIGLIEQRLSKPLQAGMF